MVDHQPPGPGDRRQHRLVLGQQAPVELELARASRTAPSCRRGRGSGHVMPPGSMKSRRPTAPPWSAGSSAVGRTDRRPPRRGRFAPISATAPSCSDCRRDSRKAARRRPAAGRDGPGPRVGGDRRLGRRVGAQWRQRPTIVGTIEMHVGVGRTRRCLDPAVPCHRHVLRVPDASSLPHGMAVRDVTSVVHDRRAAAGPGEAPRRSRRHRMRLTAAVPCEASRSVNQIAAEALR